MRKFCLIPFFFLSVLLFSAEYEVSLLNLPTADNFQFWVTSINDSDQVFGEYDEYSTDKIITKLYLFDIPTEDLSFVELANEWIFPIKLNNAGQFLGHSITQDKRPFLWDPNLGLQWIDVPGGSHVQAVDVNDLGQVIGLYRKTTLLKPYFEIRPFLWENGTATDMGTGSQLALDIGNLGYNVVNIVLQSINNNGDLAGYFEHGLFNNRKGKYVSIANLAFFWNGAVELIPLPNEIEFSNPPPIRLTLNNNDVVLCNVDLISENFTYLWDSINGLQLISGFRGKTFNDSNTILGQDEATATPALWRSGVITTIADLLGVTDLDQLAIPYSVGYDIEKIGDIVDINDLEEMVALAFIWGNWYPCILKPVN